MTSVSPWIFLPPNPYKPRFMFGCVCDSASLAWAQSHILMEFMAVECYAGRWGRGGGGQCQHSVRRNRRPWLQLHPQHGPVESDQGAQGRADQAGRVQGQWQFLLEGKGVQKEIRIVGVHCCRVGISVAWKQGGHALWLDTETLFKIMGWIWGFVFSPTIRVPGVAVVV